MIPLYEIMRAYFSQERVKPIFMDYMEMTPASYDEYVKNMTLKEFNSLFAKDREWYGKHFTTMLEHRLSIERFWKWLDQVKKSQDGFMKLINLGIWGAVLGIIGWYWKVQRFEDRILKKKADTEAPKLDRPVPPNEYNRRKK